MLAGRGFAKSPTIRHPAALPMYLFNSAVDVVLSGIGESRPSALGRSGGVSGPSFILARRQLRALELAIRLVLGTRFRHCTCVARSENVVFALCSLFYEEAAHRSCYVWQNLGRDILIDLEIVVSARNASIVHGGTVGAGLFDETLDLRA